MSASAGSGAEPQPKSNLVHRKNVASGDNNYSDIRRKLFETVFGVIDISMAHYRAKLLP